jgi:4,5-dihydroxyphthalate decarboxylase
MPANSGPLKLKTLLGNYPNTAALKTGALRSDIAEFEFVEYSPTNKGFRPMVREQAFDVSEMAIVTYLMAKSLGKPMTMLPAVVMGRPQHPYALYNAERGKLAPNHLSGKRVGIRSVTTTTGAWMRGILQNDYHVDLESIDWVSFEDPHVAEYRDTTTRASSDKNIIKMLLDGELDAVIGDTSDDPRLKPLIADPLEAGQEWIRTHGAHPINHVVVVSSHLLDRDLLLVSEVYSLLKRARDAANLSTAKLRFVPFGVSGLIRPLQIIMKFCEEQQLLARKMSIEDVFDQRILSAFP